MPRRRAAPVTSATFPCRPANAIARFWHIAGSRDNRRGGSKSDAGPQAPRLARHNLRVAQRRHIRAYIATGRQRHGQASATHDRRSRSPLLAAMRRRLRRGGWRSRYRLRKHTVEPVFGITKHARGFRQFLLRGVTKVAGEWSLLCTTHNLRKLAAVWA